MKQCVLHPEKTCNECNACNMCDLNPNKICDNCFQCLDLDGRDYVDIPISDIFTELDTDAFHNSAFAFRNDSRAYTVSTLTKPLKRKK